MNAGESLSLMWIAAYLALLLLALVSLCVALSMRARARKVERWLVSEMTSVKAKLDALGRAAALAPSKAQAPPHAQTQYAQAPPYAQPFQGQAQRQAVRQQAASPQEERQGASQQPTPQQSAPQQKPPPLAAKSPPRSGEEPAFRPADLVSTLNEMLKGDQPYNFVEALHAMDSRLTLLRLTPREDAGAWSRDITLETGGDGLFAAVQGDRAMLFPNYSRFSATLDPRPLFDGARHDGRIHSILRPALLEKQADGTWLLEEKGRVQMRQGSA